VSEVGRRNGTTTERCIRGSGLKGVFIAIGLLHGTSPSFSDPDREECDDRPFYARGMLALTSEVARSCGKRGEWEPTEALAACLSTYDSY